MKHLFSSHCMYFTLFFFIMLRISSYNCKSFKRNIGGIARLCDASDIVFLQEHWLFPSELPLLNNAHEDFISFGTSSIDPSRGLMLGRPFGDVAVLWKNDLASVVKAVTYDDDRIIGLECHINDFKVLYLGVYLPYDNKHNFDQYVYYLSKLKSIIDDFDSPYVCILGDFNADIYRRSEFGTELQSFCLGADLKLADVLMLPQCSITHMNEGSSTESWLDHIVCTGGLYPLLHDVGIDTRIVSSDHFPIFLRLDLGYLRSYPKLSTELENESRWLVDWTSLDGACINDFVKSAGEELSIIHVPYEALECSNNTCSAHNADIEAYYDSIVNAVRNASRSHIAHRKQDYARRAIPGWSEFVEEKHTLYGDLYSLWAIIGKPRQGYIYDQLRIAKSQFKYALRYCLKNEKDLRAKALADKFVNKPHDIASFWKEVRRLNSVPPVAQSVAGVSGETNIACMWKNHFSDILNSVDNPKSRDSVLRQLSISDASVPLFSVPEILDSISELSSGRSPGCDELYAEHFKFAGAPCAIHLSLCFSMMLRHNFLPPSLSRVILSPIVKDKTGNISDKDNYRPIALATVSSKILERVILNRCRYNLVSSDHQFGFKEKHSTDMAVYVLKEVIDHYLRNRSPVFVCFLDARKAFDRVNHWILFDKLLRRGMPVDIVRLLATWYESQKFHVLWGRCVTEGFHVTNGVRQGGILSPYLFNVYTDDLSVTLDRSGVGCRYLGSINHLCYADDMVLLSPTSQGLQKMLDICAAYAEDHDMIFNCKKTVCMAILPNLFKGMVLPDIVLCGNVLAYVENYKYLGYHVSNSVSKSDDLELRHQYRLLCCRANSLIRKFSMCSYPVKKYLYMTYCSNISSVHLWHSHRASVLRKFIVCFNNAARMFFGYERFCSASNMFVREQIDNFGALHRKAVFGFLARLQQSNNRIVLSMFSGDLTRYSSMRKAWSSALYM